MDDKNADYYLIESKQDITFFLVRTNGLHDGYIVRIQYEHCGHSTGNPHRINPELSELRIHIMVTSIQDAVVEMVFENLSEWQIKDNSFNIVDTSVSFADNGTVIWADDYSTNPEVRENGSYVIARKMKWRFL